MKIQNVSKEEQRGMFFTVTLGGDYKEEEKPGKGLVKEGKKGQQFTTAPSKKVEDQGFHYVIGEVGLTAADAASRPQPMHTADSSACAHVRRSLARAFQSTGLARTATWRCRTS